jgi:hypothetical protein
MDLPRLKPDMSERCIPCALIGLVAHRHLFHSRLGWMVVFFRGRHGSASALVRYEWTMHPLCIDRAGGSWPSISLSPRLDGRVFQGKTWIRLGISLIRVGDASPVH